MANSHRLALATIVRWINIFVLAAFPLFIPAQNRESKLSEKELRRFNEMFFEAEKQKNLGNFEKAGQLFEQLYRMDDENATIPYELAIVYSELKNPEKAIEYAEQAVELAPDNKWFLIMLASVYREFGEAAREVEIFRQLVALEPENPDYRYELALAYLNKGEFPATIAELNKLEEIIGINEVLSEQKEKIYLELGDVEGAAGEVRRLIEAFPRKLDYYGKLARIYLANGHDEQAHDVYMQMLEIAPNDPRPHLDLAEYYRKNSRYDKSLHHLKKAIHSPELSIDQKVPVLLSLFTVSEEDSMLRQETLGMLEVVVDVHPGDAKAHAIYGDFLSREGRNEDALKAYKKAVTLPGGNKFEIWEQILLIEIQTEQYDSLVVDGPLAVESFPNQPLPYFFSGIAFLMKDDASEGIYYLEEGLNYVFGNPRLKEQFYIHLADAHNRRKEYAESDAYFEKVLSLNPDNATALNNYAYYLSLRGEKLQKAEELTARSNTLEPDNAVFLDTWAWVLFKSGKNAKALEKMEKVIAMGGGKNGEILEHYGDILLANGQSEKALEQYLKARELGDTSKEIDRKIKNLQNP